MAHRPGLARSLAWIQWPTGCYGHSSYQGASQAPCCDGPNGSGPIAWSRRWLASMNGCTGPATAAPSVGRLPAWAHCS